ncbi:hypothetical protein QBD01_003674 [Ochrobactrum sp. 19YEA23]|uniref:hypothetical protein n=1 Tax=Ochrobactrum sp. 19YEA23 TaxID=3039854 RepID=UPI00247A9930|nr:hypothetical protein [Ochrobactrum sp. 19YEA23]
MKAVLIVFASLLATPAFADDVATKIGEQAQKCWNMPSGVAGRGYSATLEVEFDKNGNVIDITAKKYPKDAVGKTFVLSASRAIERCAPFIGAPVGKTLITFSEPGQKKPINPFKD